MKTISKWLGCEFGVDTDGKLKLVMEVEHEGDIPKPIQLILAFDCLASIAKQEGMDEKELFALAFGNQKEIQSSS